MNDRIVQCDRCPRLLEYCAEVAVTKRRAYLDCEYWGRPVPNFGDPSARLLIVGLAPGAHGANRTGRMFTGDRSGDWLYGALHRAGFANQSLSAERDDGLTLRDAAITAACHCAPPGNKPSTGELAACREWLQATIDATPAVVLIALGQIAWQAVVGEFVGRGWTPRPRPRFAHGHVVSLPDNRKMIGCYHPSQQNTFTGRLTEPMLDDVFAKARSLLHSSV